MSDHTPDAAPARVLPAEGHADAAGGAVKKAVSAESFVFLGLAALFFGCLGSKMGAVNMLNTMMNTAADLLLNTVFYIMAIAVIAGSISALFSEFGVVSLLNWLLSPLMKPLYDLPGACVLGVFATYFSDNPAILALADDVQFRRYFKRYQLPALTNIGTSFGMGLIITSFMIGLSPAGGGSFLVPVLIGNLGAVIGSVVSVRIMLRFTAKELGRDAWCTEGGHTSSGSAVRSVRSGGVGTRFITALLDGGKSGVSMGMSIIPGVLTICTAVMMLTNGPSPTGYTGAAYEGVALLPWLSGKLDFLLAPLFGFSSPEALSVPITSLGAAGAAIGLVPRLVQDGLAAGGDIAVFTAMCMCWSGYLSTHIAMMDTLGCGRLAGKAIFSHTLGGLAAGVSAHWLYDLASLL